MKTGNGYEINPFSLFSIYQKLKNADNFVTCCIQSDRMMHSEPFWTFCLSVISFYYWEVGVVSTNKEQENQLMKVEISTRKMPNPLSCYH